jgi:hypothetical protein
MMSLATPERNLTRVFLFLATGVAVAGCRSTEKENGTASAKETRTAAQSTSKPHSVDWKPVDQAMGRSDPRHRSPYEWNVASG